MKWDVADPSHRAVIAAARDWGMSPSAFTEGSRSETTYEYDETGRMVRSVTRSLDWSEEDVLAVLALRNWEADLCPGCRQPMSETTHPDNMYGYVAELPTRCHRCTALEMAGERYAEQDHAGALFMNVHLKEKAGDNDSEIP